MLNQCTRYATVFVLLINSLSARSDDLNGGIKFFASLLATSTNLTFHLNYDAVLVSNHNTRGIRISAQWQMAEVTPILTLEYARQPSDC